MFELEEARHYLRSGHLSKMQGYYVQAIHEYTRAIDIDPKYAEAYYSRAVAHDHLDRFEEAIADFDKAVSLAPDTAELYRDRAMVYLKHNDNEKAIVDLSKAISLDHDDAKLYCLQGGAYRRLQMYRDALNSFREAVSRNPTLPEIYLDRAILYASSNYKALAVADLDRAAQYGAFEESEEIRQALSLPESWVFSSVDRATNAFQCTDSINDMRQSLVMYPQIATEQFFRHVEDRIANKIAKQSISQWRERLEWLKLILSEKIDPK